MIRAVLHARASQHARCLGPGLGPSYQGQSPAPRWGRRATSTSWPSKETVVSVLSRGIFVD